MVFKITKDEIQSAKLFKLMPKLYTTQIKTNLQCSVQSYHCDLHMQDISVGAVDFPDVALSYGQITFGESRSITCSNIYIMYEGHTYIMFALAIRCQ